MAKTLVAVWIVVLIVGCSSIFVLQSSKPAEKPPVKTAKASEKGLNNALKALSRQSAQALKCKHNCQESLQKAGGVENLIAVLQISLDKIQVGSKCGKELNNLKVYFEKPRSKTFYKQLTQQSKKTLNHCHSFHFPLYYQ